MKAKNWNISIRNPLKIKEQVLSEGCLGVVVGTSISSASCCCVVVLVL